jgi:hypothetical protein
MHERMNRSFPMKPADNSEEVLFRETLMEGRRRNPQISQPRNGGESKRTKKNPDSGANHLR